jgi:hypothetical protein
MIAKDPADRPSKVDEIAIEFVEIEREIATERSSRRRTRWYSPRRWPPRR